MAEGRVADLQVVVMLGYAMLCIRNFVKNIFCMLGPFLPSVVVYFGEDILMLSKLIHAPKNNVKRFF